MDNDALRFQEDGFIQVVAFMGNDEMNELELRLGNYIREIVPHLPSERAMYEDRANPASLKYIGNLEIEDSFFREFLWNLKIVRIAEKLLGDKVVPQHSQYFSKPPRSSKPTPSHQDGFYFNLKPNEAVTFWLALDDIDEESGILYYFKGSQKRGLLPHQVSDVLGFSQRLSEEASIGEPTPCKVQRGDALLHHSLTVHAAGANSGARQRRALSCVYYAQRARVDKNSFRRYQESARAQQRGLG